MSLVVLALVVGLLAGGGGLAYAAVKGVRLFRDVRRFTRSLGRELDMLNRTFETPAAREPPEIDRAAESFARLQASWGRLSILLGALGRVREQGAGFAAIYPRK